MLHGLPASCLVLALPPSHPSVRRATPSSAWQLSQWNFRREYAAIRQAVRFNDKTRLRAGEARRYNQADGDSLGIDLEGIFRKAFFGTLSLIDLVSEPHKLGRQAGRQRTGGDPGKGSTVAEEE